MEHAAHQLHRLIEPCDAVTHAAAELDAEGSVLGLEPGRPDAQHGASG